MRINVRYRKVQAAAMLAVFALATLLAVFNFTLLSKYGTGTGYLVLGGLIFAGAAVCSGLILVYMLSFSLTVEAEQVTCRKWFRQERTALREIRDARIIERTGRTEYTPNSLFFRGGGECVLLRMEKGEVRVREGMEKYQELKSLLASRGIIKT